MCTNQQHSSREEWHQHFEWNVHGAIVHKNEAIIQVIQVEDTTQRRTLMDAYIEARGISDLILIPIVLKAPSKCVKLLTRVQEMSRVLEESDKKAEISCGNEAEISEVTQSSFRLQRTWISLTRRNPVRPCAASCNMYIILPYELRNFSGFVTLNRRPT